MKKLEELCPLNKTVKIVLLCITGAIIVFGIGFLMYKLFSKKTDDYDFYDELDKYYDDSPEIEEEVTEQDFAE